MTIPVLCKVDGCDKAATTRGMCSVHYKRVKRHGSTDRLILKGGIGLAWLKEFVAGEIPEACVQWAYARDVTTGYGSVWFAGKTEKAHRASFAIYTNQPIPKGSWVLHSCDNRLCVNPKHLRLGSARENTADALARNRWPIGHRNNQAKLTDDLVRKIRADRRRLVDIAASYGISMSLASQVRRRQIWVHVS